MTRALVLLAALAGCNRIFDLRPTEQFDAAYFDAPPDAPYACPAIGTVPVFSTALHQYLLQECDGYAESSTGHAVASCTVEAAGNAHAIFEGNAGEPLQLAAGIPLDPTGAEGDDLPRISPDGERLLLRHLDYNTGAVELRYYAHTASGWSLLAAPPFADRPFVSTLAQGPTGLHVIVSEADTMTWTEWIDEGGTWRSARTHTRDQLALPQIFSITLSSDGLRGLVYGGTPPAMYYVDRPTVTDMFSAARAMPSLPITFSPFMSADCGRVYLSGLGYVFYVQQQ